MGKSIIKISLFALSFFLFAGIATELNAQRGVGVRFAADFNHFFRADESDAVSGWYSNFVIGPFYQAYFKGGGAKIGLNILHKGNSQSGMNLPFTMNDFSDDLDVGMTAIEMDLKLGPRFKFFNPQIGYNLGYYLWTEGMLDSGSTAEVNKLYLDFTIGCSFDFPTSYGSVGFGICYEIGMGNVVKDPGPSVNPNFEGSKLRSLNFEINTVFSSGSQERKNKPPPPPGMEID